MISRGRKKFKLIDLILISLITAAVLYIFYRIRVTIRYNWAWDIIPKYLFRFNEQNGRWSSSTIINGFMMTIKLSIWE